MNPQTNHSKNSVENAKQHSQTASILKNLEIFIAISPRQVYIIAIILK